MITIQKLGNGEVSRDLSNSLIAREPLVACVQDAAAAVITCSKWSEWREAHSHVKHLKAFIAWMLNFKLRGRGRYWTANMGDRYGHSPRRQRVHVQLEGFTDVGLLISISCPYMWLLCELITDELTGVHTLRPHNTAPYEPWCGNVSRVQRNQAVKFASSKWISRQKAAST